jgi:hypothetical protein
MGRPVQLSRFSPAALPRFPRWARMQLRIHQDEEKAAFGIAISRLYCPLKRAVTGPLVPHVHTAMVVCSLITIKILQSIKVPVFYCEKYPTPHLQSCLIVNGSSSTAADFYEYRDVAYGTL